MPYYLGIDGGGTKTRCVLADETTVLAKSTTGGSNVVRLGEAKAWEALRMAIGQVCATAKISADLIQGVCIGVAGAARPEIEAKIRGILAELVTKTSPTRIEVVGDSVIALEAAFGAGPGVIAIAGTGSIVYGRDVAGRIARAGGWGFAVSDEGSGHWIGRRAISKILRAGDQGVETPLTGMVLEAWGLDVIDELVQQANSTPAPDFPRLFSTVLRAAGGGDAVARDLLSDAGTELSILAAIAIRRLSPDAPARLPVATTGSVFRQSQDVREVFYNNLRRSFPGIDVRPELTDPVDGALARARAMRG